MSDSVRPHRRQPTRLPRPWDSPGKNTGVGCHFLPQCMKVKGESEVAQSCLTLSNPMDCSLPGSSVQEIFQARVLEWGAIAFSPSKTRSSPSLSIWETALYHNPAPSEIQHCFNLYPCNSHWISALLCIYWSYFLYFFPNKKTFFFFTKTFLLKYSCTVLSTVHQSDSVTHTHIKFF